MCAFATNRVLEQVTICGRKLNKILAAYSGDLEEQIALILGNFSISNNALESKECAV